jgi:hypothetical protein
MLHLVATHIYCNTFLSVQIKGADPRLLHAFVKRNAGPNPPQPPLPEKAEEAKLAGNVSSIYVVIAASGPEFIPQDHFKKGEYNEAVTEYSTAISIAVRSTKISPSFA